GARFVSPVLRELQSSHPKLSVELELGSSFVDMTERDIDVAVRIGRLPDSSLLSRTLGYVPRVLIASTGYLQRVGPIETPNDLERCEFIFYGSQHAGNRIAFEDSSIDVRPRGRFTVNNVSAIQELVEAGVGVHLGPLWAFAKAIHARRLVALLPEHPLGAYPLRAIHPPAHYIPAKTARFLESMTLYARESIPGLIAPRSGTRPIDPARSQP
ncbi:MAG: substrate binding domain-containing protein, partial [Myxococcota bacterium]